MAKIVDQEIPRPEPVMKGSVFAHALGELISMTKELEARRAFDEDVVAWLQEMGFSSDFEAWRERRVPVLGTV